MIKLLRLISLVTLLTFVNSQAPAQCRFENGDNYEELVIVEDNGVTVISGVVTGLGENRWHGFHVHEFGDLSDGCKACGGHFNPYGKNHGGPESEERHVGDLGNIWAVQGGANVFVFDEQVKLTAEPEFSIIGRSIVIHENEDDLGESGDPSGNSGARLKCCKIEWATKK